MSVDRSRTLDGLRGIAAMAVVVQHCLEFTPLVNLQATFSSPIEYLFANTFNFGRFGVIVFFLISGYLIPSSIGNSPRPILSFYTGRFFRLYPLYWLSLLLALIALASIGEKMPSVGAIAANTTMIQTAFGQKNIIDPYWTLFVEHIFYAACIGFFLIGALHDRRKMRLIVVAGGLALILVALVVAVTPRVGHESPLSQLMSLANFIFLMVVGHNIRLVQQESGGGNPIGIVAFALLVVLCVAVARQMAGIHVPLLSPLSVFLSTAGAILFFVAALKASAFRSSIIVYTGRVSYGLYLFHAIALWIAMAMLGKPTNLLTSIAFLAFVLAMTFAVSSAAFHALEEPFIAVGKTLRRRLTEDKAGSRDRSAAAEKETGGSNRDPLEPFNEKELPAGSDHRTSPP